jgi:hypothetical protein
MPQWATCLRLPVGACLSFLVIDALRAKKLRTFFRYIDFTQL